jgi:hypothetical protein
MSFHHSPKIVTDGLVFYVNPSSKKCIDKSFTGLIVNDAVNDLTNKNRIQGKQLVFDFNDKSFLMNNTDGRLSFYRDFANVPGKVTYMCSFYLPPTSAFNFGSQYPFIFSSYDGNDGFAIYFNASNSFTNGYITFNAQAGGVNYEEIGYVLPISNSAGYDKIYTVAGTADNGVLKLYINGKFINTVTNGALSSVNSLDWIEIGFSEQIFSDTNALIRVYSSMIYNRALTDQEVLQNYNALKGRYKV